MKKSIFFVSITISFFLGLSSCKTSQEKKENGDSVPRIVNIVNFIRLCEPRIEAFTENVLYEAVSQQVKIQKKYNLPGTFLLQYDALIDPRYQKLLKDSLASTDEVGGWWEITEPHVKAAGMEWRGRYPWDWHANVGFSTGYTPEEREKLVDVYMEKFKSIFGQYPQTVGSWFIDAHTLGYMYDKYGIIGSCNCKDQWGTDGYTLWGGYWNNAYYPSRKNAYMPAQTEEGQIPVPIFRMLGSDPLYQYESGLGGNGQGVETLEPVYARGGGNEKWVDYFFQTTFTDPALGFTYAQVGQENSFTWPAMKNGFEIQMPRLDSLRNARVIRIETLAESSKWFKEHYKVTPPTATVTLTDIRNEDKKGIWFNSRFYRASLLCDGSSIQFRDIHLFDEQFSSRYLTEPYTSTQCIYQTLPLIDAFAWSTPSQRADLRFCTSGAPYGKSGWINIGCSELVCTTTDNTLTVSWVDQRTFTTYKIVFYEDRIEMIGPKRSDNIEWVLVQRIDGSIRFPFNGMVGNEYLMASQLDGFTYQAPLKDGWLAFGSGFTIYPSYRGKITIDCAKR